MSDDEIGETLGNLDLSNCLCSPYHTCQWCLEHSDTLHDPRRAER